MTQWNAFRRAAIGVYPVLAGLNLRGLDLRDADLTNADLRGSDLSDCTLDGATLDQANLDGAILRGASLIRAHLLRSTLAAASLAKADLTGATFTDVTFDAVDFDGALCLGTVFVNCHLGGAHRLQRCDHRGPSALDVQTMLRSGDLPLSFLRGVGLPDLWIDYLPSLRGSPIQLYTCFISYATSDVSFVGRLHADLQDRGLRCWFAPEDLRAGDKLLDTIHEAIRMRDKLLVVMSEASIGSGWVEDEVSKAFAEERGRPNGQTILVPISLDDAFVNTTKAWAVKIREQRFVQDFSGWEQNSDYRAAFERLLPVFERAQEPQN